MGRQGYLLAGILVLAAVLRTVRAGAEDLWMDEGLTLAIVHYPWKTLLFQPVDPTPGLYYMLHKALIPAEAPLIAIRGLSIAVGIVSVGLMYALGRVCLGPRAGLIAAALLAVWPLHVDYSQEARAYSLLFGFVLVSALGLALYDRAKSARARWAALFLFAGGTVGAFYTHVVAIPFIGLASLALLWSALSRRRPLLEPVTALAVMAALSLAGVQRLWLQSRVGHTFDWLVQASPSEFLKVLTELALPAGLWANPFVAWRGEPVRILVVAIAVVLLIAGLRRGRALLERPALAVIGVFLAIPPALWAIGFVAQPVFMLRSNLIAAPGVILAIAGLAAAQRRPAVWAAVLVGAYLAGTLGQGLQRQKPRFLQAVEYVREKAGPTDRLIICPVANYPAVRKTAGRAWGPGVLGLDYDGTLLPIEAVLGGTKDWSAHYHRIQLDVATRRAGEAGYEVRAGDVVWVLDADCRKGPIREGLEALLDQAGARPIEDATARGPLAWTWGEPPMGLARYELTKDTVWRISVPAQAPRATNQPLRNPSSALP